MKTAAPDGLYALGGGPLCGGVGFADLRLDAFPVVGVPSREVGAPPTTPSRVQGRWYCGTLPELLKAGLAGTLGDALPETADPALGGRCPCRGASNRVVEYEGAIVDTPGPPRLAMPESREADKGIP